MTLGRTASGAIKIKTDGGLRAVECACCGGGCACVIPILAEYCFEITIGGALSSPPPYILKPYYDGDFDGRPVIVWAVDYGSYQGAPYLSYWSQGIPPNYFWSGPYTGGTNSPTFYYTNWAGDGAVWEGDDLTLCNGLVAQGLCKVSC